MGRIEYRKGDMLKNPPEGVYLLHACNAQGVWGSGIAKQFKDNFPKAFIQYKRWCESMGKDFEGAIQVVGDDEHPVVCFVTSKDCGPNVSSPEVILRNTQACVDQLQVSVEWNVEIWSPKINSGLFKTPWEKTEEIIEAFLASNPDIKWVVWEL